MESCEKGSSPDTTILSQPSSAPEKPYRNLREYTDQLHIWLYQYRMWSSVQSFSMMFPLMLNNCQIPQYSNPNSNSIYTQHTTSTSAASNTTTHNRAPGHSQGARIQRVGTVYSLPPLWKRVAAEIIDFIVLFYLKVMMTVLVLRQMGYLREDNIIELPADIMPKFDFLEITEMDVEKAFSITSELIALEVVNRMMITVFETLCLCKGLGGMVGGATPGKRMLGLKVVSCIHVTPQAQGKILVCPARDIGFFSALIRSVIKNFTMAFFFPACLTVFIFKHNRAAYDILAKTIVVDARPNQQFI
ncbi:protein FAM8A1-like [Saccostrea cucullata]|uniref:protein FAM8A1-like n=1 Tax=Saccostrea cuccullata TaxID=36930 RepID=UPI002ED5F6B3